MNLALNCLLSPKTTWSMPPRPQDKIASTEGEWTQERPKRHDMMQQRGECHEWGDTASPVLCKGGTHHERRN